MEENLHQLRLVAYPIINSRLCTSQVVIARFLPSTVCHNNFSGKIHVYIIYMNPMGERLPRDDMSTIFLPTPPCHVMSPCRNGTGTSNTSERRTRLGGFWRAFFWEGEFSLNGYEVFYVIWVFPKIGVPQNGWFIRKPLLKWMIWGYHYFRKHLYSYSHGSTPNQEQKARVSNS